MLQLHYDMRGSILFGPCVFGPVFSTLVFAAFVRRLKITFFRSLCFRTMIVFSGFVFFLASLHRTVS